LALRVTILVPIRNGLFEQALLIDRRTELQRRRHREIYPETEGLQRAFSWRTM
jgi:hypothetical protein